jgi:hypothetical protein
VIGFVCVMSLDTAIRPVLMSHRTSHESKDSKIGFVTPAMNPGLCGVQHLAVRTRGAHPHGLPLLFVQQVGVRERALDEPPEDGAAAGRECARGEDVAGDLPGRAPVSEEDDALAGDERVEEDDNRRRELAVRVQVRVQRALHVRRRRREGRDELDERVLRAFSVPKSCAWT